MVLLYYEKAQSINTILFNLNDEQTIFILRLKSIDSPDFVNK